MAVALDHKVNHALNAVDSFCHLLEDETAALLASNFVAFESMQDKKMELAQVYQDSILAFEEDIDLLQSLDESFKEKLRMAHVRFTKVAEENQSALITTKNVSERITKMIMKAAKETVMDTPNYGSTGAQDLSEKIPVHFKLNEML